MHWMAWKTTTQSWRSALSRWNFLLRRWKSGMRFNCSCNICKYNVDQHSKWSNTLLIVKNHLFHLYGTIYIAFHKPEVRCASLDCVKTSRLNQVSPRCDACQEAAVLPTAAALVGPVYGMCYNRKHKCSGSYRGKMILNQITTTFAIAQNMHSKEY